MYKEIRLVLSPEQAYNEKDRIAAIRQYLGLNINDEVYEVPTKRSIDARQKQVKIIVESTVYINEKPESNREFSFDYQNVANAPVVLVVGAGPAGLFAALRLIELGLKPLVVERGKDVRARRRDIAAINKEHIVNPESNYCFGEGGAGTYSDGKLYTRSKKRGNVRRILEILQDHGAADDILFDSHPHIGTNKLPQLVSRLSETILAHGGEILFNTKLTDIQVIGNRITAAQLNGETRISVKSILLCTGHSARDIYHLLQKNDILIEAKPFALGLRIEHPQSLIDSIQYHCDLRDPNLPAAAYQIVQQTIVDEKQRGVFSFCMCPGGFIVPAATSPGEVVVNGMSPSKRDSRFANSGIVVAVEIEDFANYSRHGALAGMHFQAEMEQKAWQAGGMTQRAPAQRLVDFVNGKVSSTLSDCSYIPGIESVDLRSVLNKSIYLRLKDAFKQIAKKMPSYYTNEAQLLGVESRSSSPVRIPRDAETLEHLQIEGLFPCGEGAGYAGGIVSAAIDGERCAEKIAALKRY